MNNLNTKNKANKNKRFAAMLAAAVITISGAAAMLTGCGSDTETASSNTPSTSSSAAKETTTGTVTSGTDTTDKASGSTAAQKADNTQTAGGTTVANADTSSQSTASGNTDDIKVGIDRETAISNVKTQAGSGAEIISCTKGYAPDGISCWIVVVAPVTNGSTPEQIAYYSGYQFCYPDRNNPVLAATPSDGQNPMMNFIGTYTNGRATMTVSCIGKNQASINISWSSNVAESSVWTMSGPITVSDDGVSVTYTNCIKQSFTYSSDGELISSTTDYENGNGSFDFSSSDYNAYWYDAMENSGSGSSFWFAS